MAWSGEFLAAINAPVVTPIYLLESVSVEGAGMVFGEFHYSSVSSWRLPGYEPALSPEGSSISSGLLNVGEWSFSVGQWEIGLDEGHGRSLRYTTVRGQPVALKIGFPGWTAEEFQTVALGQIQNIIRRGERWVVQVRSLLAGLTGRWTETAGETALFHKLPIETFTTTAFTAGTSTTIVVDNVTGAEKETGSGYIIEITPDDGDPLIYYATTLTVKTFSVLTLLFDGDTTLPDGSAKVASAYVTADEQVNVRIGALVKGDPAEIVRKILMSTGTANANGAYDTLPASFGLGLSEEHFDVDYFDFAQSSLLTTAAGDLYAHSFDEEPDALAFIARVLAPFGAFVCERQGQISISAMVDDEDPAIGNEWIVTDSDIVDIAYEAWNSNQPTETGQILGQAPSETAGGDDGLYEVTTTDINSKVKSRPNTISRVVEFPFVDGSADPEWISETSLRTYEWFIEVGEAIELTCRGWRLAAAAPGDHLVILSERVNSRDLDEDLGTGGHAHIIAVEPDWFGSTVKVRAVFIPSRSAAIDVP